MQAVCDEQGFVLGPRVVAFEESIARYIGSRYAIGCASGSDALLLSLMAMGVKAGDEVVTIPFTFFATASAVSRLGAKPVFVDIQADTFNIDPGVIEHAITPRTKAIIPVHLFGQCADMAAINEIARRKKIRVIEDACQAIGAAQGGKRAGYLETRGALVFSPARIWAGSEMEGLSRPMTKPLPIPWPCSVFTEARSAISTRRWGSTAGWMRCRLPYYRSN